MTSTAQPFCVCGQHGCHDVRHPVLSKESARAAVEEARFQALRYQAAGHVHLTGYWREQVARRLNVLEAL